MSQLPQLPRYILCQQDQPGYEKEIWQPQWNCFCCQDTGIVRSHLARLVIPDYNWSHDALPICQHPSCHMQDKLSETVLRLADYRFTATLCQQLDQFSRDDWKQTIELKHETLQQLAQAKSLRKHPRTPEEEELARSQHQLLLGQ